MFFTFLMMLLEAQKNLILNFSSKFKSLIFILLELNIIQQYQKSI